MNAKHARRANKSDPIAILFRFSQTICHKSHDHFWDTKYCISARTKK